MDGAVRRVAVEPGPGAVRAGGVLGREGRELLGMRPVDLDWGEQLIRVVRKGSRAEQWLPASAERFVWLRLYLADLAEFEAFEADAPLWWTLRGGRGTSHFSRSAGFGHSVASGRSGDRGRGTAAPAGDQGRSDRTAAGGSGHRGSGSGPQQRAMTPPPPIGSSPRYVTTLREQQLRRPFDLSGAAGGAAADQPRARRTTAGRTCATPPRCG